MNDETIRKKYFYFIYIFFIIIDNMQSPEKYCNNIENHLERKIAKPKH